MSLAAPGVRRDNDPMSAEPEITQLLHAASEGDSQAAREVLPLVYEELRKLAASRMRALAPGQTLQATALVHEAYLRVVGDEDSKFATRDQFFFVAARAMRDILVEQARRKSRIKHGGAMNRVDAEHLSIAIDAPAADMLALNEALEVLETQHPRMHELVMLRFFAGLTEKEAASVLGVDPSTAQRDWRFVRGWIHEKLGDDHSTDA